MNLLRVNLSNANINFDSSYPESWGRELIAQVLNNEINARCHPLDIENKLIIANGPLAGTGVSSCGRLSIGGKSPLTGGIKEANAGGSAGDYLAGWGIRGIILEGAINKTHVLLVGNNIELIEHPELFGLKTTETTQICLNKYGKQSSIICIGPAGDHKLSAAGIAVTDREGRPSRYAARGGLGAVMASKGLKAIVIQKPVKPEKGSNNDIFKKARKEIHKAIRENPATGKMFPQFGTAITVNAVQKLGAFPTYNFRQGSFEHADKISGEALRELILERSGEGQTEHSCMSGCIIKCSNVFPDKKGEVLVSPIEYETIGMMGSNLGIGSLDEIARLNKECNELGLDTIETGAALGVAMDQGVIEFGDSEGALRLLNEIAEMSFLGRIMGNGAEVTGKVLGSKRIPTVKGQSFPAYDPRAIKGLGVTYASSPMGADHTAGYTVSAQVDHHSSNGQLELSLKVQIIRAALDSWGVCSFMNPILNEKFDLLITLVNAARGTNYTMKDVQSIGERVIKLELAFNKAAGIMEVDGMPDFMRTEKLPPFGLTFDVSSEDIVRLFNDIP